MGSLLLMSTVNEWDKISLNCSSREKGCKKLDMLSREIEEFQGFSE